MFRKVCFIVFVIVFLSSSDWVYAYQPVLPSPPSFEEKFTEVGYKSVNQAINEFEDHFKQEVILPSIMPPLAFSHKFGRFFDDKYEINDSLHIYFANEKSPCNNYSIDIRPLKNKVTFKDGRGKKYALQNGRYAIYIEGRVMNNLIYETSSWQYILGIDIRVSNKVTPEILVKIANSTK